MFKSALKKRYRHYIWKKHKYKCGLCGEKLEFPHGHNPEPLATSYSSCCNACHETKVMPARMQGREKDNSI